MACDLLIKDISIIDDQGDISHNKNIYIKDGLIDAITEVDEIHPSTECINGKGQFVSPGLVNLHTHSPMNIFRGIAEDVTIDDWFNKEIWPYESKLTSEDVYFGAVAAIGEMIHYGVTAFADHYFFADQICDAVLKTGIKADIAPTVFGMAPTFEKDLEDASRLIKKRNGKSNRLNLRLGPHGPHTCPDDTLETIISRAKSLQTGIHIHLSETYAQVQESKKSYGKTPFERLFDAGGFDIPCIIGHGLWIQENERKYLNEKTYMAVCPKTYMKLGMGKGNIWEKSAALPLCTGTDGAASSNTLNPLEQARIFALVGKFNTNDPTNFDLKAIWRMLMNGHKALPFHSGKIKKGYSADLIVWDLNNGETSPLYNPLAAIIYSAEASNITHTIVDGRLLKKNNMVQIDEKEALNRLKRISSDIIKRGKGTTELKF